jgi:hypothetical protein
MFTPQLTQAALRADFLAECKTTPQLLPLQALVQLVEADELDNVNLFTLLWSMIQNDSELKEAYQSKVDPEMDRAARVLVEENPPAGEHMKYLCVYFHLLFSFFDAERH